MIIKEYLDFNLNEIFHLYSKVGWTAYTNDIEALEQGFRNSLSIYGAYDGDKLIGLIRVVGDGFTIIFIQDLLVLPEYQRQGIGSSLINIIINKYSSVRQIELATDNTEKTFLFYKSVGFSEYSEIGCRGFIKSNN